jgi:anti-sigma factor RsiW
MNGSAMDCSEARLYLLDDQRGRLDVALAGPLAAHLADCAACAREDQAERLLTEQLERRLPQYAAPLAFKRRLAAEWAASATAVRPGLARTRRTAVLAAVGFVALMGAVALAVWVGQSPQADRLVAEAVTDHLRLLARADALEVRSGDVHQLRPWLTSRLDFAPVIPFAGDAEFPLRGGTIEYFLDRRAAAAVYGRRLHTITLLVVGRVDDLGWPAPGRSLTTSARGFNVRLWQGGGLGYALVSDVDGAELAKLAARLGG